MRAFLIGIVMMAIAMYIVLPVGWALGWWSEYVLPVLKGALPLGLLGMGGMFCLLGIADIRDRAQARREQKKIEENE